MAESGAKNLPPALPGAARDGLAPISRELLAQLILPLILERLRREGEVRL
jgi:hypothetical protein